LANLELLEEQDALSESQIRKKIELGVEFFHIIEEEELYWFKRCHETWLLKGGNNTDLFHRIANGRRRKQTIFSLKSGSVTIQGDEELLKHVISYCKALFGPGECNAIELDPNLWSDERMVNEHENFDLTKPF
jgi:hypothetical protein